MIWTFWRSKRTNRSRMLKKAPNFVLGSKESSTYPRGYASGSFSPAASLADLFEHPEGRDSPVQEVVFRIVEAS